MRAFVEDGGRWLCFRTLGNSMSTSATEARSWTSLLTGSGRAYQCCPRPPSQGCNGLYWGVGFPEEADVASRSLQSLKGCSRISVPDTGGKPTFEVGLNPGPEIVTSPLKLELRLVVPVRSADQRPHVFGPNGTGASGRSLEFLEHPLLGWAN